MPLIAASLDLGLVGDYIQLPSGELVEIEATDDVDSLTTGSEDLLVEFSINGETCSWAARTLRIAEQLPNGIRIWHKLVIAEKRFVNKILRGERAGTGWGIPKAACIIAARNHARTFLSQRLDRLRMANHRFGSDMEVVVRRNPCSVSISYNIS